MRQVPSAASALRGVNGAMWFARGSGAEPVYPPCPDGTYGFGDRLIGDVTHVRFNIFPDGGVGRLRLFGRPCASKT